MGALHELRDRGLIVGRNGRYSRHHQSPCEWYAVWPWPLCYCSMPKVPKKKAEPKAESVPWKERTHAKEFVPIDGEPEEDTGLVYRSPTSVGKGQRRLET